MQTEAKRATTAPSKAVMRAPALPAFSVKITTAAGQTLAVKVVATDKLRAVVVARKAYPKCVVWGAQ